jgi:hypothetical protein
MGRLEGDGSDGNLLHKIRNRVKLPHEHPCFPQAKIVGRRFEGSDATTKSWRKNSSCFKPRNPLKSLDSGERIQGNPTLTIEVFAIQTARTKKTQTGSIGLNAAGRRRKRSFSDPAVAAIVRQHELQPPVFSDPYFVLPSSGADDGPAICHHGCLWGAQLRLAWIVFPARGIRAKRIRYPSRHGLRVLVRGEVESGEFMCFCNHRLLRVGTRTKSLVTNMVRTSKTAASSRRLHACRSPADQ